MPSNPLYLDQILYLTSCSDEGFSNAIANIHYVYDYFAQQMQDIAIKPFKSLLLNGHPIALFANRLFTLQLLVPCTHFSGFSSAIDPENCLFMYARWSKNPLITLTDNNVSYLEQHVKTFLDHTCVVCHRTYYTTQWDIHITMSAKQIWNWRLGWNRLFFHFVLP